MSKSSKKSVPTWAWVVLGVLLVLVAGAALVYRMVSVKKKEITHYGFKKIVITESSIAQGQITYDGYAIFNTSLPKAITPDKVTMTTVWDRRLKVTTKVLKPKHTDNQIDTLFFAMSNDFSDFMAEMKRQQKKDSSLVEGTVTIKGNVPLRDDNEPLVIRFSQKVRHFKFPIVLVGEAKITYQGLKRAHLTVPVEIKNLDRYYLSLRNVHAKFRLGQDADAELKNEPNMMVGPYKTKTYEVGLDVDVHKPGKIISKVISNKDVYVVDEYMKMTVGIGKPDSEKTMLKDNSVWQEFPIVMNQKDTLELKPKKGEDRFAPGKKKQD